MSDYSQINKGSRIVTSDEYAFLNKMLDAIKEYYRFCEDKDQTMHDFGTPNNEAYWAVEFAFEKGLIQ